MKRWSIMLSCAALGLCLSLSLFTAGCTDKVAKCKEECTKLDKEYMAKCTGEGAASCKETVMRTTTSCNKLCEEAMK